MFDLFFSRQNPAAALIFLALGLYFTWDGANTLYERGLLDRDGVRATATVTRRYVENDGCASLTAPTSEEGCTEPRPKADFTFQAGNETIEATKVTSAVFNFMETQDSFEVLYLPADTSVWRVETGRPDRSGLSGLPFLLLLGPAIMALSLLLFWWKRGFKWFRRS